ncbi:MAG TPA: SpoIID/LytB domain-containing protein [bacterium]|nr:SpoIID/LytB domain-containing protein [bacterium]
MLFLCLAIVPAAAQEGIQLGMPIVVNMMVFSKTKSVTVKIDGEYTIFDGEGKIIQVGTSITKAKLIARLDQFFLANHMIGADRITIKTYGGVHIFLNGNPFGECMEFSINGKGTFSAINRIKLEKYLIGVLAGEIDDDTPLEAMKAQAVISRTFAVFSLLRNPDSKYQMTMTNPQAYRPIFLKQTSSYARAVKETEGVILTYKNCVFPTYFSAVCGGETEFSGNVWELDFELPETIKCPYCRHAPEIEWRYSISLANLKKKLNKGGMKIGEISSIDPKKKSAVSERVTELVIRHSKGITHARSNWLRNALGSDQVRSTNFSVAMEDGKAVFAGRGWGHGVGLCQAGAAEMGKEGCNYQDILRFYYPGSEIKKLD